MILILVAWIGVLSITFALRRFVQLPRDGKLPYTIYSFSDYAMVSFVFSGLAIISQHLLLASVITIALLMTILIVNAAKVKALAEPMVFSDFALFKQVFDHPRLYLPFLNLKVVIPLGILGIVAFALDVFLEPTISALANAYSANLSLVLIQLFAAGVIYFFYRQVKPSLEPNQDIIQYGFLSNLLFVFLHAKHRLKQSDYVQNLNASSVITNNYIEVDKALPTIVVVQSESFFDARRLSSSIKQVVLKHFDSIKQQAVYSGKLMVDAWGANTMRSEFAFLTGIPPEQLHEHQYNPYQLLPIAELISIVSFLKQAGYYCIAIHPHPAAFFRRDRVFKQFGFDEFIDIKDFAAAEKFGPYISDKSVTDKIIEVLSCKVDKPLFVFAITMENHGPLHLENYSLDEVSQYLAEPTIKNIHDLIVYLRHLRNADAMIDALTTALLKQNNQSVLCWYGDHVPSMPNVYNELAYQDASSDYFIWSSTPLKNAEQRDIHVVELSKLLLDVLNDR